MHSNRLFVLAVLLGILVPLLAYSNVDGSGEVVISELMWMGSNLSTADEWIEIVNTGSGSVDVSGWSINFVGSDSEEAMVVFASGTLINSGDFFLVSNYAEEKSRLAQEPDVVTSAVRLSNSKLLLRLRDASGQLVDEVDDGTGAPFAGANPSGTGAKASMERIDMSVPGSEKSNWKTATMSLGFDEGMAVFGTPGFENSVSDEEEPEPEPEPEPDPEPEPEPTPIPDIFISEILANPKGRDDHEWIELVNAGTGVVNLKGWMLKRGSNDYVIEDVLLNPQEVYVFRKSITGISLRNAGDTIELWRDSLLIDTFTYPETAEEVSYGRSMQDLNELLPFCVPTEGALNVYVRLNPQISIQSGKTEAQKKVSINLEAVVSQGSLASATCHWDFGDGKESDKCNPPSHSFTEVGVYDIELSVESFCGSFREKTLRVEVVGADDDSEDEGGVGEGIDGVEGIEGDEIDQIEVVQEVSTGACIPTVSSGIVISEIFPSPSDGEEWIELKNVTDESFELCGWVLDDVRDGGSKSWTIPEGYAIPPLGFAVLTKDETKLTLNNGGDDVWLVSPDEEIEIGVTYPKIKKDKSYALRNWLTRSRSGRGGPPEQAGVLASHYCISDEPTPGEGNVCPLTTINESGSPALSEAEGSTRDVEIKQEKIPVKLQSPEMQVAQFPIRVKYKNVVSAFTQQPQKEDVLTGALASLLMEEPLMTHLPPQIMEVGNNRGVSVSEVILVIAGVCSSGALFLLKMLRG